MKKLFVLLTAVLFVLGARAQTNTIKPDSLPAADGLLKKYFSKVEKAKSGNAKDVLHTFIQLAAKDFSGNNPSFGMSTTLFALKLKGDSSLLQDTKLVKETFSRNFQFNFNVNVDSVFKLKGFTGGFTYAIINQRDHKLVRFHENTVTAYRQYFGARQNAAQAFTAKVMASNYDIGTKTKMLDSLNKYRNDTTQTNMMPSYYSAIVIGNAIIANKAFKQKIDSMRAAEYLQADKAWLWTVSAKASTNTDNRFNSGSLNTVLLKGGAQELDVRGALNYTDTVVVSAISRWKLTSSAGFNLALVQSPTGNLVEFKPYFSYDSIIKGLLPGEEKDVFAANADLRVRITKTVWIPFTLKYDLQKHNFLGFLNVSLNMDALKGL